MRTEGKMRQRGRKGKEEAPSLLDDQENDRDKDINK